jgi:antitoxin (DNA-binding transcriptional repressor) of toxin-antitoxin stability system
VHLQETNVAELRKHIKRYLDAVESGEIVRIYRRGKQVAEIKPLTAHEVAWRREAPQLIFPGLLLSREILRDRSESDT